MNLLPLTLLLLLSSTAFAESHVITSVDCELNSGRFVASVTRGQDGRLRAKITRHMNNQTSIRFEGTVNLSIGDTADGSTALMFESTEIPEPSFHGVPEFHLMVTDGVEGVLYSNHFRYPELPVKGSCRIAE